MLEFYKNDSGVRLSVDELEDLGDRGMLEVVVEIVLALDEGFIDADDDEDFGLQEMIKKLGNPDDLDD